MGAAVGRSCVKTVLDETSVLAQAQSPLPIWPNEREFADLDVMAACFFALASGQAATLAI